jgi:general stress protein 26
VADKTLSDIAKAMRHIDIAILSSVTATGAVAGRPMSNNRDVDFDGDSYFFANDGTDVATQIAANPQVGLGYQGHHNLYISVSGKAELVREKAAFEAHWTKDLDKWFEDGVDTPGLVLIHVKAAKLEYWDGRDQGEIRL